MTIDEDSLPYDRMLEENYSRDEWNKFVLNGGEDYQLVFSGEFSEAQLTEWSSLCEITRIGRVEEGSGVFLNREDKMEPVAAGGWVH